MILYVVTGPVSHFPAPIVCATKSDAVIAARAGGTARKHGAEIVAHQIDGKQELAAFATRLLAGDMRVIRAPGPRGPKGGNGEALAKARAARGVKMSDHTGRGR